MAEGYIKLYRQIAANDLWFSEPFTRGQAWVDLLLIANHKDGFIRVRGNKIEVKRGQVGHSILTLADRWKWSRGKVGRFLDELELTEQIVQQKKRISTLITITNYEKYQHNGTTDSTTDDTTDGQQTDTNKNVKNDKNEKNKNLFEQFWKIYPKKRNKGQAEKAWIKIPRPAETLELISTALDWQIKSPEWKKQDGQFIPNPATYLNAKGWEDEKPTRHSVDTSEFLRSFGDDPDILRTGLRHDS